MAVTMTQIAELAGVSRGTVDRVLNHRGRVRDEVAERVLRVAQDLGYQTLTEKKAHSARRSLAARGGRLKIGVVTQLSGASFMIPIRKGITEAGFEAQALGIELVIRECASGTESEQCEALDALASEGIDALAVMPVECDGTRSRLRHFIHDLGIPVVTFNTDIVGVDRLAFIGIDNEQGGRAAAGLLGTLMRGSGNVLGIIGSFSNSTNLGRINGFSNELAESFPGISLVGISPSMDRPETVAAIISNTIRRYPDLGGIAMISSGQLGIKEALSDPELKELMRSAGDRPRPYIVIYDLTPKNRKLMEEGFVDFTIDQDGYSQGYRSIMTLAGLIGSGRMPQKSMIYTDITIRTRYTSP